MPQPAAVLLLMLVAALREISSYYISYMDRFMYVVMVSRSPPPSPPV